ncbi:MAG TPA: tRNA (adenosine(37)-N6)-threonylcarbamoyltransferase complex ATPase subunit type 1 TsaE, partial [Thermomicrobiales bacterium]|nr:tRNA (adenosine(37)-N6)-threonylcarbamoyltransferase complex ATPase subunit type 1 TsaE [Thermomicrobiales bacterium]
MVVRGGEAMRELGRRIGVQLTQGDVVLLHGDLGAGKTTLTQGIAAALGVPGVTQSPTFTLISEYPATLADGSPSTLYHLDLYRLDDPDQLVDIGWEEAIDPEGDITVVEWPERAGDWLPDRFILVSIAYLDADSREVTVTAVPETREFAL